MPPQDCWKHVLRHSFALVPTICRARCGHVAISGRLAFPAESARIRHIRPIGASWELAHMSCAGLRPIQFTGNFDRAWRQLPQATSLDLLDRWRQTARLGAERRGSEKSSSRRGEGECLPRVGRCACIGIDLMLNQDRMLCSCMAREG